MQFFTEDVSKPRLSYNKIKDWIKNVILAENKLSGQINVIFSSDEYLLNINQKYLSKDNYTDVICFNYNEGKIINADIFISSDRVEGNAKIFNVEEENEYLRVIVHGILHLAGHNDVSEKEKNEMRNLENKYLSIYGS